ncbi:MAG: prepilin peptidase [bacterium]|nr:prepilin peptidase [bacterium]
MHAPSLTVAGVAGLLAYLGAAVWCDARGRRLPAWCCAVALAAAVAVAAWDGGIGARDALAGAAVAAAIFGVVALALGAGTGELRLAVVAGAWLGPVAVLHGTVLGAATIVLGVLVHGAASAERPTLATALAVMRGPRAAGAGVAAPLPIALPLAAGYAAAAVLAVNA